MPKVGRKHFSYSKAGKKAAKRYAKKTGKKVTQKKGTPNPVAKNLRSPQYKSQVIPSQKVYNRKKINKTAD
tara:strand:+ start:2251 stop:2463 length:213 start_codon:yes stop_codon:yes gene_type:complete